VKRKNADALLKLRNEKLFEIAYLQSHEVRRPVATILGLITLLDMDNPGDPVNKELIPKFQILGQELGLAMNQIIVKTNEIKLLQED
jgi:light-regulated signal transduction histidine kinase (bacteriophytochrome)